MKYDQGRLEARTREWLKANSWMSLTSSVEVATGTVVLNLTKAERLQGVLPCRRIMHMQDRDWHEYFVVGVN